MFKISDYASLWPTPLESLFALTPWQATTALSEGIRKIIPLLGNEFRINGDIAIHPTASIEENVVLKGPLIIGEGCFVAAHAYLRNGVFLAPFVSVGPGCEIKTSLIMTRAALAHFNFVGDSLIGSGVNMEAGSIIANHYNERDDKEISVRTEKGLVKTGVNKFGALVGDYSRIGANAVLSPGTILQPKSIVARLELVDQSKILK